MRYDYPSIAPVLIADLRRVTAQMHGGPVERSTLALVELRVSQLNGCAFCIDRHAREALRAGVPLGMVIGLSAWRDDQRFSGTLRAALALAEALTEPVHHADRDAAYAALDALVSPAETVHLTIAIALAGAWNRIASGCQRQVVDAPWPQVDVLAASSRVLYQTQTEANTVEGVVACQDHPSDAWAEYRSLLSTAPDVITSLIRSLPHEIWHEREAPGQWSIHQVAAHLVHMEVDGWMPRIRQMYDQSAAVLPRVDAHTHLAQFAARPMEELLSQFSDQRRGNVLEMDAYQWDSDQLDRTAEHPDQGPLQIRHLIATWCMHDLSHMDQIVRIIGVAYAGRVGPLAPYLRLCRSVS